MTGAGEKLNRIRRPINAVALFAVALAGGGTLLAFVARAHWRLELLSHFRVQYFWVLALACVMLVAGRRFVAATVAGALAAVNLALIVSLYLPAERPADGAQITRAMSLNVYFRNRQHERVLALIREEKPDFVLLLEVTTEWALALRALNQEYPYSRVLPHGRDSGGMALYSRLPIESLDVPGQDDNRLPVKIALPSGNMTLLCAHPASPSSPWEFGWRNDALYTMAQWAAVQNGPLMVLGDLNTTSWSPYFADFVDISGLTDSRQGFGVQGTWPGLPVALRIPIDHCLVSSQIAVLDRRVGPAVGSDHRPIIVDFTIVEAAK